MKRPALVFFTAGVAAVLAYLVCYHFATRDTREMMAADGGNGIAWLRQEFSLTEEQTRSVAALQQAYEPRCMEMCARIVTANQRIEKRMREATKMTPELRADLEEASRVQAECHAATLAQTLAISAHMAPDQAVRYRTMIAERVLPGALPHDAATHR